MAHTGGQEGLRDYGSEFSKRSQSSGVGGLEFRGIAGGKDRVPGSKQLPAPRQVFPEVFNAREWIISACL